MHPTEIAASYDRIAGRWADPSFNRNNGIAAHKRALQFTSRRGVALDVGCGCSGRFIDLLASEGFAVEGLDVSSEMIRIARQRHPGIPFHHADICEWESPQSYDFITAWDSIWHVPLGKQELVLSKLCGALAEGGVLIWTTGGLDGRGEKRDAAMGTPMYYSVLGISETLRLTAAAGCACRHLEYDQLPEKHVFMVAQKVPPPPRASS